MTTRAATRAATRAVEAEEEVPTRAAEAEDAVEGVAPELVHFKVLKERPLKIKGRAYETEVKIPADVMMQIQRSLDEVRPSGVEKNYFTGNGRFAEVCLLCDLRSPCGVNECVKEQCMSMRSYQAFLVLCTCLRLHAGVVC